MHSKKIIFFLFYSNGSYFTVSTSLWQATGYLIISYGQHYRSFTYSISNLETSIRLCRRLFSHLEKIDIYNIAGYDKRLLHFDVLSASIAGSDATRSSVSKHLVLILAVLRYGLCKFLFSYNTIFC